MALKQSKGLFCIKPWFNRRNGFFDLFMATIDFATTQVVVSFGWNAHQQSHTVSTPRLISSRSWSVTGPNMHYSCITTSNLESWHKYFPASSENTLLLALVLDCFRQVLIAQIEMQLWNKCIYIYLTRSYIYNIIYIICYIYNIYNMYYILYYTYYIIYEYMYSYIIYIILYIYIIWVHDSFKKTKPRHRPTGFL